jgi:hypothetical protein
MKNVFQQDDNGCWLACASMLTGVSYDELKTQFNFRGEVTGRAAGPLIDLLERNGLECERTSTKISKIGALQALERDALVYFKNVDDDGDEDGGHWMVWDSREQVIRDPEGWKSGTTFRIKNFRRVKAKQ